MAASRNAGANELIRRGKLREALTALNDAIYAAPDYPHSYATRARVFERLGMLPQADADRRKARELAQSGGYSEEEVFAEPPPPRRPPRRTTPRTVTTHSTTHTRRRQVHPRLPVLSETAVVLVAMAGLAATALGAYLVVGIIQDADINLNVFDFESFREETPAEPTVELTVTPSPEPTPPPATPPAEALQGNPYSFSNLQSAWHAKGLNVALGYVSPTFSGFTPVPFDITLTRGESSANVYVLIYKDRNGPSQEWNLSGAPTPAGGRRTAPHERGWFNSNVIVLLRSGSPEVANLVKDAFLGLGG
jgi:hypothetical protein